MQSERRVGDDVLYAALLDKYSIHAVVGQKAVEARLVF